MEQKDDPNTKCGSPTSLTQDAIRWQEESRRYTARIGVESWKRLCTYMNEVLQAREQEDTVSASVSDSESSTQKRGGEEGSRQQPPQGEP